MVLPILITTLVTIISEWYSARVRFWDRIRRLRRRRQLVLMHLCMQRRAGPRYQRRQRRCWKFLNHQHFWERDVPRFPDDKFHSIFRMSRDTFNGLCNDLRDSLEKQETQMRKPASVEKRVAVALYYLKSGADYGVVGTTFGIGKTTVCCMIEEFCDAVCNVYKNVITFPTTAEEQEDVSKGFLKLWQFPNTLSAIDGTHIPILTPQAYGEDYYNYKGWHSTILMAAVDYRYRFTYTNIGYPGKVNDAGVFQACALNRQIADNLFDRKYHIIGDGAFPLSTFLMKPFIGDNLPPNIERYNYRLSRARMVVECAFGRLKGRWRVLLKRCDTHFEKTVNIILTCCILHNICEKSNDMFQQEWLEPVNDFERMYPQPNEEPYIWDGMDGQGKRNMLVQMLDGIPLNQG